MLAVWGSSLWVGLEEWLVKGSWLWMLELVFWWVELDLLFLECNETSSSEFWAVCGFGVTLGRLYIKALGYVPALLENLHDMSCSGTCWLLGEAWFHCMSGGFLMSYYCLMFLDSGVVWCSLVLDLSLLLPVFSLTPTVASRLLYSYSTDDKTSRLMEKRFSTVRDTQKGLLSYMEKRRRRREIAVTRRRRGGIKRGKTDLASNQFPKCSPHPGTHKENHRVV